MLVSLRWLEELLQNTIDVEHLKKVSLSLGLEIEEVSSKAPENVVIGTIMSVKPHPRRNDLHVLGIQTNTKLDIISADLSLTPKVKVLVCPAGSQFKGQKITTREFDGVTSHGMLVSEQEIGLAEKSTSVITLQSGKSGDAFSKCFDDIVLDMSTTPNRPDWLSVDGIARDIATRLDIDYTERAVIHGVKNIVQQNQRNALDLTLQDKSGCPRYTVRLFENVTVQDSPFWMKWRLYCHGMNAVNNIVDITNIIMLLTGQPLHPFDWDLLQGGIIVRKARPNEPFTTLEGTEFKMHPDDCVIADNNGPIALGGIIGAPRAQINTMTKRVALESAYFDPKSIAHTSRRLDIITEASTRFERGGNLHAVDSISALTGKWFARYAKATQCGFSSTGKKGKPTIISFRPDRLNEILALDLKRVEVKKILKKIDIHATGTDVFKAQIPHYRRDLEIEEDIYEEVARIYGYMNIPETPPTRWGGRVTINTTQKQETLIRNFLVGQGFSETYNLSLTASAKLTQAGFKNFVTLKNPLNERFDALRPTLFVGLVDSVTFNLSKGNRSLKLFEIGNILLADKPFQERHVAIILGGLTYPEHWGKDVPILDYYDAKGTIENLCDSLHVKDISFQETSRQGFTQTASILVAGKELGYIGNIDPHICKEPFYYAELSIEKLISSKTDICYISPPKYPANTRDLSFLVDTNVEVPKIMASICTMGGPVLARVTLFDYYRGKNVPSGQKNLGFRLYFRAPDRTLNDKEVDKFVDKIEGEVSKRFSAKLRKKE